MKKLLLLFTLVLTVGFASKAATTQAYKVDFSDKATWVGSDGALLDMTSEDPFNTSDGQWTIFGFDNRSGAKPGGTQNTYVMTGSATADINAYFETAKPITAKISDIVLNCNTFSWMANNKAVVQAVKLYVTTKDDPNFTNPTLTYYAKFKVAASGAEDYLKGWKEGDGLITRPANNNSGAVITFTIPEDKAINNGLYKIEFVTKGGKLASVKLDSIVFDKYTSQAVAYTPNFVDLSLNLNASADLNLGSRYPASLTFTSSNNSIATVNTTNNKVYAKGRGVATITANWDADASFTKGSAQFTVTVTAPAGFSFPQADYSVNFGSSFTAPALAKAAGHTLPVTYTSTNPSVATVDASGNVTPVAPGITVIKATADAGDNFAAGEAKYTLTVNDPSDNNVATTTFDLTTDRGLDITEGVANAKFAKLSGAQDPIFASQFSGVAVRANNTLTITVGKAYRLLSVKFTTNPQHAAPGATTASTGMFDATVNASNQITSMLWATAADVTTNTVTLTFKAGVAIQNMVVTYTKGAFEDPGLKLDSNKVTVDMAKETSYDIKQHLTAPAGLTYTYTSDNAGVATVDNAGVVTVKALGSARITITSAEATVGDKNYAESQISLDVVVRNSDVREVTFDFETEVHGTTFTLGDITLKIVDNPQARATWSATSKAMIVRGDNQMVITAAGDYKLVGAKFVNVGSNFTTYDAASNGELNIADAQWYANAVGEEAPNTVTISRNREVLNVQKVTVYYSLNGDKEQKDPGLKFDQNTYDVQLKATPVTPVLTVPEGLAATYVSSDESVAKVDATTGALEYVSAGEATITATTKATLSYLPGLASYTLNIAGQKDAKLSFNEADVEMPLSDNSYKQTVTLPAEHSDDLVVTYTVSNDNIAAVAADGTVTFKSAGYVVVEAATKETEYYLPGAAKYGLTIYPVNDATPYVIFKNGVDGTKLTAASVLNYLTGVTDVVNKVTLTSGTLAQAAVGMKLSNANLTFSFPESYQYNYDKIVVTAKAMTEGASLTVAGKACEVALASDKFVNLVYEFSSDTKNTTDASMKFVATGDVCIKMIVFEHNNSHYTAAQLSPDLDNAELDLYQEGGKMGELYIPTPEGAHWEGGTSWKDGGVWKGMQLWYRFKDQATARTQEYRPLAADDPAQDGFNQAQPSADGSKYVMVAEKRPGRTLEYYGYDPESTTMGAVKAVDLDNIPTGIVEIEASELVEGAEYYNLQGVRVMNPANGLYIMRNGNEVRKVVIK